MSKLWLVTACLAASLGCASTPSSRPSWYAAKTSGAAHFQLAPLEHSLPDTRCAAEVTLPSPDSSSATFLQDDAQGADVTCRFDATHFEASLYGEIGGFELRGTFAAGQSFDSHVRIDLPGAHYESTVACVVVFDRDAAGVLSGSFSCPEIESHADGACAVGGADASGKPTSVFSFQGCTPL